MRNNLIPLIPGLILQDNSNSTMSPLTLTNHHVNQFTSPIHYPPLATNINNLTFAINGTGTNGIYNSSFTPVEDYGIYNWCNMPHIRSTEYITPSLDYTLKYVEIIHRHHKRTPYASNTFFREDVTFDCMNSGPRHYCSSDETEAVPISWQRTSNTNNPFEKTVGPGFVGSTCQFPQITKEGLTDSEIHGKDIASVYGGLLGFLPLDFNSDLISFRVTNNDITSQVLGALMAGLYPLAKLSNYEAVIQSSTYDSLEPTYSCPTGSRIYNSYTGSNPDYQAHLIEARSLYDKLDSVSGIPFDDTAGWHVSFDHYFDNLSAKLCHDKALPCSSNDTSICVTQAEADKVFRLGQLEYSYFWRDAILSTAYSRLRYGAFFIELRANLIANMNGNPMLYRHNVGHDGSISPLLGILQIETMVWPGMGSEVVFELYEKLGKYFLRVLWGGQPLRTSTPLGELNMIPIQDFLDYLEVYIPSDLVAACRA